MDAETQWKRGFVHSGKNSNSQIDAEWLGLDVNFNFNEDAWDDSIILDIFDEAIKSHKVKKEKVKFFNTTVVILSFHYF